MALNSNGRNERATSAQNRDKNMKKNAPTNKPDLTEAEAGFLRALLLDAPQKDDSDRTLDDNVLFSLPFHQEPIVVEKSARRRRRNTHLLQLWHAFEDGVKPKVLLRHASNLKRAESAPKPQPIQDEEENDDESVCSARSDEEVRVDRGEIEEDDISSCSSWKEEEGGQEHYDSWEVLKDEYAGDFGFDYKEQMSPELEEYDDDQGHVFKILGTSADDTAAHPHVLSPPLMDALMSFIPESLENQNFWLKYSLVRDGSSMNTLKHYVRASANTILAIETTTGEVFGAFTTSPWRTQFGFFGVGDGSFLWRMRHNRHSPCHSLFEQAQLETEIDVFAYSGLNNLIQHCSNKKIGIGGGNVYEYLAAEKGKGDFARPPSPIEIEQMEEASGFGIVVDEFLARGTTSPCATFRNPSLLNNLAETETFTIANMEVWTLTPSWDVNSAEKMEMTKYFVDQSLHSSTHSSYSDIVCSPPRDSLGAPRDSFVAAELNQQKFFRRVGENDDGEEQRDRWQYANMMGLM